MDECHAWDDQSVWHKDWPHKIYVGQWPIFCGPVILLNILTVCWRNIILEIMDQCDIKIGLINYMWVIDLYFEVQWFCLISWRSAVTINYFDTLNNGAARGIRAPLGTCSDNIIWIANTDNVKELYNLSHITRKPVFGVCDQLRLKPACSADETS